MKPVFADTFYFIAALNPDDQWHSVTIGIADRQRSGLVTTEAVLTEFADALARPAFRQIAAEYLLSLPTDPTIEVVQVDGDLWRRGLALYQERPDKEWSLTDCISFIVMEDRGIGDALTGDSHFEQAGFNALLRTPG